MDAQAILEALLNQGKQLAEQGKNIAEDKLDIPAEGSEREAMLSGMGKGALAAGALAMLLGTGAGRRITSTGLKLGSLAAIGGIGYQAFKRWQDSKGEGAASSSLTASQPIEKLPSEEANQRAQSLLRAMITAARVDGHIDSEEQNKLSEQIEKLGMDSDAAQFFKEEMSRPIDPEAVAAGVDSQQAAMEIYLATLYIMDDQSPEERAYLQQLAQALQLPDSLVASLEAEMNT
ncbi:MAG: tellurite resistance TerB family protein [bacterium]